MTKENVKVAIDSIAISRFIALASVATFLPFIIHLQWFTGPIVNAILILILFLVGIRAALLVCVIPSLMALSGGLLPIVLAPIIPFIVISNAIFVLSFYYFRKSKLQEMKSFWLGAIVGASLKFMFLYSIANFVAIFFIKKELVLKVMQMMSWPQFFTAMTGSIIAWGILKFLKKS